MSQTFSLVFLWICCFHLSRINTKNYYHQLFMMDQIISHHNGNLNHSSRFGLTKIYIFYGLKTNDNTLRMNDVFEEEKKNSSELYGIVLAQRLQSHRICISSESRKVNAMEREKCAKRRGTTRKRDHVPIALFIAVYRVSITFICVRSFIRPFVHSAVRSYVFAAFVDVLLLLLLS